MGKSILFVDDERSILKALERLVFDCDYEAFFAESGEEGLKILENQPIDIVVSDMRMPVMNGHQFLRKVKEKHPGTTRIVLSGYASENDLFESIIDGSSSLYLIKPWNGEKLKTTLERIFTARELYRNHAMLEFANKLENLSMIPGIYNSVNRLIEKDADISAIAKVIETDITVTAAILRVVNSAFYNIKTGSIQQAIKYLGLTTVKSIVLSCSIFQSVHILVPPFFAAKLSQHAIQTNKIMAVVYAKVYGKQLPETIATAGLLHNVGFVMLMHYYPEEYKRVLQEYAQPGNNKTLAAIEKEKFDITHAELGGYLLDWWGLPYSTVECALFHHDPRHDAIIDSEAVFAVHLASNYAWKIIVPGLTRVIDLAIFPQIGMPQQKFEQLLSHETGE